MPEIQEVRIRREGGSIGGLLAAPDVDGAFPGVVVIPTIRGLDDFMRYVVQRLAGDGFVALAVDICEHPGVPEDPFKRPGAIPDAIILQDLEASRAYLQQLPTVGQLPICAWGYCLGGRFALLWPTYQPALAAGVAFHGFPTNDVSNPNTPTEPAGRAAELSVPVIACFGENDHLVPPSEIDRYRSELEKHGRDFEVHVFAGADHGWTNPKSPTYNQPAAEDAWTRVRIFLTRKLAAHETAAR